MDASGLSDRIVAARPRIWEVIEDLEEVLGAGVAPLARRRIQQALALLHASGDVLEEVSLIERSSRPG